MSDRTINLALKAKATQDKSNEVALQKQKIILKEDIKNTGILEQVLHEAKDGAANVVESSDKGLLTHAQENNDNKSNFIVSYISNLFTTTSVSKDIVALDEGTSEPNFSGDFAKTSTDIAVE